MAKVTSGSFNTNAYGSRYLQFNWWVEDTSISGNYTTIGWSFGGGGSSSESVSWYYAGPFKLVVNGDTVYTSSTRIKLYKDTVLATGSSVIYHNNEGKKSFSAYGEGAIYSGSVNCTGEGTWELPDIPRYATSKQTLSSKTETSITMNWSSDSTVDYIWYSTNNGSNWTGINVTDGKSGSYTISGLTANTTYKVKTRVRRKDSQLTTDSSALSVTTYDIPYCTDTPNFTVGDELTLKLYNPLSRLVDVSFIGANGEILSTDSTAMTTVTGYNSETFKAKLYNSIPNASSGKYKIKVDWGSYTWTTDKGNTYSVNASECTPEFNDFTYKDSNTDVTDITGNDQVLIKGFSNLQVAISSANKMVAKNNASPSKYIATIDTLNEGKDYSESDLTLDVGTVVNAGTKRLTVTAYDTRTIPKAVYKDIVVLDYVKPVINLEVLRLNNFEAQTTLKINGGYTPVVVDSVDKNAITNVSYRYREQGGEWSEWVTVKTTVTNNNFTCNDTIISLDNTKAFDIEAKVIDKFSDNVASGTIDVGEAIFFISSNKKQCYINGKQVMTGLAQDVNRTDLNEYTSEFVAGYGHNLTNAPSDSLNLGHFMSIPRHDAEGFVTQLFSPYTTDDLYIRKCNEGAWGNWKSIADMIYPVGSIYMSVNSTNPSTLFGGTWEQLKDRFLLGAGSTYSNGATGGSATHKLTVDEMPSHKHTGIEYDNGNSVSLSESGSTGYNVSWAKTGNSTRSDLQTNSTGGSQAHNNMPPYLVVYMWKRTA